MAICIRKGGLLVNIDDCLVHYKKLLDLLEEDLDTIKKSFQGELLDEYRSIVKKEINEVNDKMNVLKRLNNR